MPSETPTLHLLCGKIASGKSHLAARLARQDNAVILAEDTWLHGLYGDQMSSVADFVRYSARLRSVVGPHVVDLLNAGVSVVLDFQANTVEARRWMRDVLAETKAAHVLHHLDVPDEVCLERLRARNADGAHPFAVTEAQFEKISAHFVAPSEEEGFDIVVHRPDDTT